jgi:hypothetical protein
VLARGVHACRQGGIVATESCDTRGEWPVSLETLVNPLLSLSLPFDGSNWARNLCLLHTETGASCYTFTAFDGY